MCCNSSEMESLFDRYINCECNASTIFQSVHPSNQQQKKRTLKDNKRKFDVIGVALSLNAICSMARLIVM